MIGIIGGSGLYEIEEVVIKKTKKFSTPFGDPSDSYMISEFSGIEVVFLPRHGSVHHIPPHKINYRANIWGFKELGVERVISLSAVGGISPDTRPGTIVIPDQIIDMTKDRDSTFYDGGGDEVVHIDFTEPYCPELRESIFGAGRKSGVELKKSGTYVCVNGPRLETKAEIEFFSGIGGDVVGMTAMPEASLAREAELCFAGVTVVTNYAAGIKEKRLTTTEVIEVMRETTGQLKELLKEFFKLIPIERRCLCKEALKEAKM
jgi:5'-methylthioadenosine phosphorylase